MSRTLWWSCGVFFSSLLVAVVTVAGFIWRVPAEATILRAKLPYVSLQSRLEFEKRRTTDAKSKTSPLLSDTAIERLGKMEYIFASQTSQARLLSLQKLHSIEVRRFIKGFGNGINRMGKLPTPDLLEFDEPAPLRFSGEGDNGTDFKDPGSAIIPDPDLNHLGIAPIPSLIELDQLHLADQMSFTDPWSLGDVRDRKHVAGFVSHGFRYMPILGDGGNEQPFAGTNHVSRVVKHRAQWSVESLELVSLLKFEEPAVYVSEHLPRMNELSEAKTRTLTAFERQGLASLRSGEDLDTLTDQDEILMLGSLRAIKQCLDCHVGQRGDLLGAFSYKLRRMPPQANKATTAEPST